MALGSIRDSIWAQTLGNPPPMAFVLRALHALAETLTSHPSTYFSHVDPVRSTQPHTQPKRPFFFFPLPPLAPPLTTMLPVCMPAVAIFGTLGVVG